MSQRGKTMERPQNNTAEDLLLFYNTDQHFWERRDTTMSQRGKTMERPQNNTVEDVLKNLGLFPSCQLSWELTTGTYLLIYSPQKIYIGVHSLTLTLLDIFTYGGIFVIAFENLVNLLQKKVPQLSPC